MPIKMLIIEGGAAPIVVCDVCGERIEHANEANYEWSGEVHAPGDMTDVLFLHKECVEANEHQSEQIFDSMDLTIMVPYLADNLHLDWDEARAQATEMMEL